jgi:Gpi18-like mannosyltransferase
MKISLIFSTKFGVLSDKESVLRTLVFIERSFTSNRYKVCFMRKTILLAKNNVHKAAPLILFIFLIYRVYLCLQVPYGTDIIWHLGFASHAFEKNFGIYQLTSDNFESEFWSTLWPGLPYAYPPVMLMFFFTVAKFHLGFVWVKLALTFFESVVAFLFYRISRISSLLFYCAPLSLWNVSLAGQNESLQTLFIALNAIAIQNRRWMWSGFLFAISVQVKLFGILLLPWFIYKILVSYRSDFFLRDLFRVLIGFLLGILPFLGFYFRRPDLLFLPVRSFESSEAKEALWSVNPFEWTPWDTDGLPISFPYVSSLLTYFLLFFLVVVMFFGLRKMSLKKQYL